MVTERTVPSSVDPLGEALHFLRMSGTLYCRSEFTAPWGLALPALPDSLMFHIVTRGACWLQVSGEAPVHLDVGGFALVPHGRGHDLTSDLGVPVVGLFDVPTTHVSERYEVLHQGGGGAATTLICGAVRFDHPAAAELLRLLPAVIPVDSWGTPELEWMRTTLGLMAVEAGQLRPGGETVITRLADILVIQAIRAWLDAHADAQPGWLAALRDPQLGRAIRAIHREPGHAWSVETMAEEACMSRSAFAARFSKMVGEPAMRYVARWRMHVALSALRDERQTTAAVAEQLGYDSEAAFARAFKRVLGRWPGEVRRESPPTTA